MSATDQHGKLTLGGWRTVAAISVAGAVARVEVAISRTATRHRCRFVDAGGRLTGARSYSKPVWLKGKGKTTWSLSVKRRLPRATYTIQVSALDVAGNRHATAAKRTQRLG